jgi:surface protein
MSKQVILSFVCLIHWGVFGQQPFVTEWQLNSFNQNIQFAYEANSGDVEFSWVSLTNDTFSGEGFLPQGQATFSIPNLPHNHRIVLSLSAENLNRFRVVSKFNFSDVLAWGEVVWSSMQAMFSGCDNLKISASDTPNLTQVKNMAFMFMGCSNFNYAPQLNLWDVSNVETMHYLFGHSPAFNEMIGAWNTENVQDMSYMFQGCTRFNRDISLWNTSNVHDMSCMFSGCSDFNQPIGLWNTQNVEKMHYMFSFAQSFNSPLRDWNTSKVTTMESMFNFATLFNQDLDNWDVSNVISMGGMFRRANSFNGSLANWNTNSLQDVISMFEGASSFNQSVATFDLSNVHSMKNMFKEASRFNQDLKAWDVSNVVDFSRMFNEALDFNQNLNTWNMSNAQNLESMFLRARQFNGDVESWNTSQVRNFSGVFSFAESFNRDLGQWDLSSAINFAPSIGQTAIDCTNYSSTIMGWAYNSNTPNGLKFNGLNRYYGLNAAEARAILFEQKNWDISNDRPMNETCRKDGRRLCEVNDETLLVHPNPVQNQSNISFGGDLRGCRYFITSASGAVISDGVIVEENFLIDMESVTTGLYLLFIGEMGLNRPIKLLKN